MIWRVDLRDELPIYEQIVRQAIFAVADGRLQAGQLVPSVREVARELAINPNTVQRAYRTLQDMGILVPVRGMGLAVAEGVVEECRRQRERYIRQRLERTLREALVSGIDANSLQRMVHQVLESLNHEADKLTGGVRRGEREPRQ